MPGKIPLTSLIVMEDDSGYQSRRNVLEWKEVPNTFWEMKPLLAPSAAAGFLRCARLELWDARLTRTAPRFQECAASLSLACAEF